MTQSATVAIFTQAEDLHGHLVAERVRSRGHDCHLVATDRLAFAPWLSWESHGGSAIRDVDDRMVRSEELSAIWWRRVMSPMQVEYDLDAAARSLVPGEIRAALSGAVFSTFTGRWINDPAAELRGDNKLVQLKAAISAGLEVPRTLVSSDHRSIRGFIEAEGGRAVVKVVRGTANFSIPARVVTQADLEDDAALEACPAMYQEIVPGQVHLRIHVFGGTVIAVRIESPHLDWRPDLNIPMCHTKLPANLSRRMVDFVQELGLAMGIIDAKLTDDGRLVFLEINPQGQFAFVEGLTGLPLSDRMAAFLVGDEPT